MACMWSVVEYLLLNPARSLGWFSSSFFSSLVVTTVIMLGFLWCVCVCVWTVCTYLIVSKLVCSSWCLFCSLSWKISPHFASFHVLGIRRSVIHFVYSLVSCFAMVSFPAFSVSMLTWSFPASFPLFHFPQRSFHFPCRYWCHFYRVCLYCYILVAVI